MSIKRSAMGVVAAVFAASILALCVGTAGAQYTPAGTLTLNRVTVTPGSPATVAGSGFRPDSPVTFHLHSEPLEVGTVNADANGTATITFTIPADFPLGDHTVTATGVDPAGNPLVLSGDFTVVAAGTTPTGDSGTLPTTGSDSTNLLRAGVLLVAAGGAVVLISRKRSQAKIEA